MNDSVEQFELFSAPQPTFTVSELTIKLRALIEDEPSFQSLWVQGEVSNFSRPQSGHWYFTIKDEGAELRCVMWRGMAANQAYVPTDGEAIEVHGSLSVYEARGQYQVYADEIRPAGQGALYQQFLKLKGQLDAEGLFAPEHKQPIPTRPSRIGVITSPTGAALHDILDTLRRRYPLAEIVLAPAAVQGPRAPAELLQALKNLETLGNLDLIILARGGGSIEDLAAFNDEALARAIFNCPIAIISGVGHETDFSISDFVADLRAPTPTAAAELATPSLDETLGELADQRGRLQTTIVSLLQDIRWALQSQRHAIERRSPLARIANERGRLDQISQQLVFALRRGMDQRRAMLAGQSARIETLNPRKVLERGYSVVSDETGNVIASRKRAKAGQPINIEVVDGSYQAEIKAQD